MVKFIRLLTTLELVQPMVLIVFVFKDAQDLDYFKIPVEDSRFNFLLQSAGSASAGWYATPGLGKIALTWEAPDAE